MSSRSFRLETRSRARDEIKRIMQTVEKVRKWEKIWIETGLSNHLKIYKWVPVREEEKKEEDEKENEPSEKMETSPEETEGGKKSSALPDILPSKDLTTSLEPPQLASGPPDLLLESETKPLSSPPPSTDAGRGGSEVEDQKKQETRDIERRRERQNSKENRTEDDSRPRSPH